MRFALEVFRAVRRAVGADFPVGARLSTSTAPGNVSAAELGQLARTLQDEDLISFLDASHGDYYQMDRMTATMAEVAGYELEPNAPLLASVSVPRMVTGRFRTLEEAEGVLRERRADIVSMVRAQIADPELVRKTREGRADQVRPCIACNQGCVGGLLQTGRMGCAVNPAAGVESLLDERTMTRSGAPKKVLIVGGGPAGMEAARVAALRGHRVILAEAGPRLGGTILAARRAPRMQAIGDFTDWLEREVLRLGVEVRTGSYVEPEDVLAERPDVLLVATGAISRGDGIQAARPGLPPEGCGLPHVTDAADLLLHGWVAPCRAIRIYPRRHRALRGRRRRGISRRSRRVGHLRDGFEQLRTEDERLLSQRGGPAVPVPRSLQTARRPPAHADHRGEL